MCGLWYLCNEHSSMISWVAWNPSMIGMLQSINIRLKGLFFKSTGEFLNFVSVNLSWKIYTADWPLHAVRQSSLNFVLMRVCNVWRLNMLSSTINICFSLGVSSFNISNSEICLADFLFFLTKGLEIFRFKLVALGSMFLVCFLRIPPFVIFCSAALREERPMIFELKKDDKF